MYIQHKVSNVDSHKLACGIQEIYPQSYLLCLYRALCLYNLWNILCFTMVTCISGLIKLIVDQCYPCNGMQCSSVDPDA